MSFRYSRYFVRLYDESYSILPKVQSIRNYKLFFFFVWCVLGGGVIVFLALPWQQTVTGEGQVLAFSPNERRQEISAPISGLVKKWFVLEGQKVARGEIIVELTDNDPELLERLRLERRAKQAKLDAARSAVVTANKNVARQQALLEKGLAAPLEVEKARLNYNKYVVDEANAVSELARIDNKVARQETQSVTSPIDGVLLQIHAGQGGQLVKQGDKLATLVPDTDSRAVELWVNGNDMPLITPGREVRLQFQGWPAVQFSGWPMVAVGTFRGEVGFIDAADDGRGHFRVVVFPHESEAWPDPRYLRQGVRTKGWFLLDQVSVAYELWRIFNGFPPALRDQAPATSSFGPVKKVGK